MQTEQSPPATPHAPGSPAPGWQVAPSQHAPLHVSPPAQLVEHVRAAVLHAPPAGQSADVLHAPHVRLPAIHTGVAPLQIAQVPLAAPHAPSPVPGWQVVPSQHAPARQAHRRQLVEHGVGRRIARAARKRGPTSCCTPHVRGAGDAHRRRSAVDRAGSHRPRRTRRSRFPLGRSCRRSTPPLHVSPPAQLVEQVCVAVLHGTNGRAIRRRIARTARQGAGDTHRRRAADRAAPRRTARAVPGSHGRSCRRSTSPAVSLPAQLVEHVRAASPCCTHRPSRSRPTCRTRRMSRWREYTPASRRCRPRRAPPPHRTRRSRFPLGRSCRRSTPLQVSPPAQLVEHVCVVAVRIARRAVGRRCTRRTSAS